MESYFLFLIVATLTVLSPGPGVILTITNAIRYSYRGAIGGILGIAAGTLIVAGVSATSLGLLLATSTAAFTILKFIGAIYLVYLGIKLWRAPPTQIDVHDSNTKVDITIQLTSQLIARQFMSGITMQLTNPKAGFFFLSILPQFVNYQSDSIKQFAFLVITYSTLVIAIHLVYAYIASQARHWLSTEKGGKIVNRLSGTTFLGFGIGLVLTQR